MKSPSSFLRCAIYARYSSERQNERSIEDQVALCRRHAEHRGWIITASYADAAISGAAMANRPGLLAALQGAERGDFDVLLAEAEDRIARNLEHLAHVVNRLDFAGVRLATITTDRVETMHVAFMGAMAQEYLKNLSAKTKRGMHANAEKGLATGARIYGYKGEQGGNLTMVPEEAEVIREIFRRYASGESPRAICEDLNMRGVPGPRGGMWNPSTLNGSRTRGNGVLACELYNGVKVWNRDNVRKDPFTGRRSHSYRPPEEWKRTPVPHLRIVDEATWQAAEAIRHQRANTAVVFRGPKKRGLFSGLIKCADCGGSMTAFNGRGRLICSRRREKGKAACTNDRTVDRRIVERRVLEGIRTRLLTPEAVKTYVRLYHDAWEAEHKAALANIGPMRRRLGVLDRTINRLVDKICDGTDTPASNAKLVELEGEKAQLQVRLAEAEREAPTPVTLHPHAAEQYAAKVASLQAAIEANADLDSPDWHQVVEKMREMVVRIDVRAGEDGDATINLHGTLAAFLKEREAAASSASQGSGPPRLYKMVAGGGLEPPTCGL